MLAKHIKEMELKKAKTTARPLSPPRPRRNVQARNEDQWIKVMFKNFATSQTQAKMIRSAERRHGRRARKTTFEAEICESS